MGYLGEYYLIDWNLDNNITTIEENLNITEINNNQTIEDTNMFENNINIKKNIFYILD